MIGYIRLDTKDVQRRYSVSRLIILLIIIISMISLCSCKKNDSTVLNVTLEDSHKILKELDSNNTGAVPWEIGYLDNEKVVFYNYKYLMAYNVDGQHANLLGVINIEDYNLSYVQGDDIKSFLSFDSLGKYIIMNNGISNGNSDGLDNMYLFDINNNELYTISNENYFNYIRVWSNKSTYFALAYKDGSKVKLYNLETKKLSEVNFDRGKIKNIAISDKGKILIQSDSIFICDNKSNKIEKISDNGQILGLYNEEILIRKGESIYRGQPNKLEEINTLDESFELIRYKCDNYIFSNQVDTIIYDAKNNEKKKFHVNDNSVIGYSSDFNKCLYRDASGISILDKYGDINSVDLAIDDIISIKWLDDDELAYIKHVGDSFKMSSFSVNRYNILTNTEKTIISLSNK